MCINVIALKYSTKRSEVTGRGTFRPNLYSKIWGILENGKENKSGKTSHCSRDGCFVLREQKTTNDLNRVEEGGDGQKDSPIWILVQVPLPFQSWYNSNPELT